ncbi:phox-like domain containing protein [Phytophthora cinnamomi]|uniref:phox-like domain containing protein n=1 Tax=Phytophthora cinnamomi TaxID=4785 RepID=UPI003559504A|nr:phox-like domain containing protein [Phytophthora cinnamomi]
MGCKNSKDATLAQSVPLRPSTPSFHAQNSKLWVSASDSQANDFREEPPSFVVSDSAELVGSSDGEPVHGMVSAFTFSFIQASETSSTNSSLGLDSSLVSDDQSSPGPPESLTFTMTGDPIELTPIPEERSGPREGVDAQVPLGESAVTEPEGESSPGAAMHVVESSGVASESTVTESSEMLVTDLDASGFSHRSEESSSNNNTGDPRRSAVVSDGSEAGEYMVTETGAVVRQETSVDPVPEASTGEDSVERESIEAVAAAVVQEVVDGAVAAASAGSVHEPRDRAALVAQSSLQVEISSAEIFHLSFKPQPSPSAYVAPVYAIVGTSTDKKGVVLYHIQLMDDVTDSARWSAPQLRRYSQFSEMYMKLKETKLPAADKLPKLPRAGVAQFVRGRQSKTTIEERLQQFSYVLRYIAEHRQLHNSSVFQNFLTQQ